MVAGALMQQSLQQMFAGPADPIIMGDRIIDPNNYEVIADFSGGADREIREDVNGVPRYLDTGEPVFNVEAAPDQTSDMQEYLFAVERDGYDGTFADWQVREAEAGNPANVPQPGLGGNYSQPVTPAQEAVDEAFADEYVAWTQGGGADVMGQISQLENVLSQLEAVASGESNANLTGRAPGNTPDWLGSMVNPQAVDTREQVEEVVQRNLRLILGAQFTEREGERLIARAYNPRLSEAENAARLRRLITQMRAGANARTEQMRYYEQNGTLTGWQGNIPTVEDFRSAIDGDNAPDAPPPADAASGAPRSEPTRPADFAGMDVDQLMRVDISTLSGAMLDAFEARWREVTR